MALQVNENRAVAVAPAAREVIHAQHPRRREGRFLHLSFEAQQRIRATRHAGGAGKAGPGFATERAGNGGEEPATGSGPLRPPPQPGAKVFGKGRARARRRQADEAADGEPQPHGPASPRLIEGTPPVAIMDAAAAFAATRTARGRRVAVGVEHNVVPLDGHERDANRQVLGQRRHGTPPCPPLYRLC